jgi:hypothetical protein
MSLLVVGSVAFDAVETPFGKRDQMLGGSASHFSISASFFTDVQLVSVVGQDWPPEHTKLLSDRGFDTSGLQVADGKTFRWAFHEDVNVAYPDTHLNVFAGFEPGFQTLQRTRGWFLETFNPTCARASRQVPMRSWWRWTR